MSVTTRDPHPGSHPDTVADAASPIPAPPADRPRLILHLGAGEGGDLDAHLASGAAHVALVEPNPASLRRLRQRVAGRADVDVHPLAVAAETGRATLTVFNLTPLSSLRPPTELTTLFPGLRPVATPEVATTDMADLLALLPTPDPALDPGSDTGPAAPAGAREWLVIDTPGEEATVLDGLARAGAERRFDRIALHCGTTSHYAGSPTAEALRGRLEAVGYRLETVEETDPDRPCLIFRLDRARLENAALRKALAERTAAFRELNGKSEWRGRRMAELEEELKHMQKLRDQTTAETRKLQEDLTLALRLQSLAQADLRDLQRRHADTLATRDRQADLLRQLTPRLQEAARYLGALRSLPDTEAEPASLPKAPSGGGGKAKADKKKDGKPKKTGRRAPPKE